MRVDEIRRKYKIESEDIEIIRTELREKLKQEHPDSNDGIYDVEYFKEIVDDFEYIGTLCKSKEKKEIVAVPEEAINYLVHIAQQREIISKEENLCNKLNASVEVQISTFKNRFRKKKYGLASVTGVLTFLWMFPENIVSHPVFEYWADQNVFPYNTQYAVLMLTVLWLYALMLTAMYWVFTERAERYEGYILEKIKIENVQNNIFMKFIKRMESENCFSKSQFMDFISTKLYEDRRMSILEKHLFKVDIYIGEDVIQSVADIILNRAIEHKMIQKRDEFSLVDYYEILR